MTHPDPPAPRPGDPLTRLLLRRFGPRGGTPIEQKAAYGIVEGWIGLVLNAVLFAVKITLGMAIGSVALIADAVHTAADSVTSAVLIVASRIARRPADREHPYGHGRAESVAAVIISVLLGVAGIEFLQSSIERILDPEPVEASWGIVVVVVVLALIKEWNARFAMTLARTSGSKAIEADSWHHRSDVFATLLVAAGIVGSKLGLPILDGVMGILVCLVIFYTAYGIARDAINPLLGEAPDPAEVDAVARTAMAVDGVEGVHDIVIHHYGDVRLVSLHIETSDKESALRLHTLAELVQNQVGGGAKGHVVVHVDPISRDHARYAEIEAAARKIVAAEEQLHSFHDLRVIGEEQMFNVVLDVVVDRDDVDAEEIRARVAEQLRVETGAGAVVVHVEPLFAYGTQPPDD